MAESDTKATSAITFSSSQVNTTGGAIQLIGATADFSGKPYGTYTDTITCTATLKDSNFEMVNSGGNTLKSKNLGTPIEFTYGGKTYYAYNDFIKYTSESNSSNADAFVMELNRRKYDGYDKWYLCSNRKIAEAWWNSDATNKAQQFGDVNILWLDEAPSSSRAYVWNTLNGNSSALLNSNDESNYGFLVIRAKA